LTTEDTEEHTGFWEELSLATLFHFGMLISRLTLGAYKPPDGQQVLKWPQTITLLPKYALRPQGRSQWASRGDARTAIAPLKLALYLFSTT